MEDEKRVAELNDFASQSIELGREAFAELYEQEPTLGKEIFDFFRLPYSNLHKQFREIIIQPLTEAKINQQDELKKTIIDKRRQELGKKFDLYGEEYKIVNQYVKVSEDRDHDLAEYVLKKIRLLVIAIPIRDKEKRKEVLHITEVVDEVETPGTFFRVMSKCQDRQPTSGTGF